MILSNNKYLSNVAFLSVHHSNLRTSIRTCLNFQNNSNTSKLQQGQQVYFECFLYFLFSFSCNLNCSRVPQFIFLF